MSQEAVVSKTEFDCLMKMMSSVEADELCEMQPFRQERPLMSV